MTIREKLFEQMKEYFEARLERLVGLNVSDVILNQTKNWLNCLISDPKGIEKLIQNSEKYLDFEFKSVEWKKIKGDKDYQVFSLFDKRKIGYFPQAVNGRWMNELLIMNLPNKK